MCNRLLRPFMKGSDNLNFITCTQVGFKPTLLFKKFSFFKNVENGGKIKSRVNFHTAFKKQSSTALLLYAPFNHQFLDFGNSLGRVQPLRACLRTIHDGVATIKPERILKIIQTFALGFITRIGNPTIGLQ